jgi:PAS domain S-box-containing protein
MPFDGIYTIQEPGYERNWLNVKTFRVGTGLGIATTDITRMKKVEEELTAAYQQLKISETKLREQYEEIARSEERLKKSEAEVSGILRAAPVGIGLISADRVFIRVNDRFCTITGYSRDELVGKNARFLYPDENEYIHAGKFYTLGNSEGTFDTVDTRFLRKDGTMRDIRFYGTPIDPSRPGAGNIFIVLDITDEKRLQNQKCTG